MEVSGHLHTPAAFFHGVSARGTHWIGRWVDPRIRLDGVGKRLKNTCPSRESKSGRPAHSLATILAELSGLLLRVRTPTKCLSNNRSILINSGLEHA